MILLDSNTLIFYIRGMDPVVIRFQSTPRPELRIPSIVAYEIEYGALRIGSPRRRRVTEELLAGIAQVPFDARAAREPCISGWTLGIEGWRSDLWI
jgi:tRNA(fMet)-specific endonuclease VapC